MEVIMKYRFATVDDIDAIYDLIQRVGSESPDFYHYSTDKAFYADLIKNNPCVVCYDKDKIVGSFISYAGNDDINNVYKLAGVGDVNSAVMFKNYQVDPEYRGRKIGMTMGGMLWSYFIKDYDVAVATVHPYNIASVKSLTHLGFEIVTITEMFEGKHRYIMRKNLKDLKGVDCLTLRG